MAKLVRITVNLSQEEANRLIKMTKAQFRHPREQARPLLASALRTPPNQTVGKASATRGPLDLGENNG